MRAVDLEPLLIEHANRLDAWFASRHPKQPVREFRELQQNLRLLAQGAIMLWRDDQCRKVSHKEFNEVQR